MIERRAYSKNPLVIRWVFTERISRAPKKINKNQNEKNINFKLKAEFNSIFVLFLYYKKHTKYMFVTFDIHLCFLLYLAYFICFIIFQKEPRSDTCLSAMSVRQFSRKICVFRIYSSLVDIFFISNRVKQIDWGFHYRFDRCIRWNYPFNKNLIFSKKTETIWSQMGA